MWRSSRTSVLLARAFSSSHVKPKKVTLNPQLNPPPSSASTFAVLDPATGHEIAQCDNMSQADAKRIIAETNAAGPSWAGASAKERAAILRNWNALILKNSEYLAHIATAECGKPLKESRTEVAYAASFVAFYAEEALRVYGDLIPANVAHQRILVTKQPVGLVACITPWNFPLAMITRKAAPGLAVGCPIVLKPAHETPLSAQALIELAVQAGVPRNVFTLVTSDNPPEIGNEFGTNALIRKLSFTGSTPVGKHLMSLASSTVKRVSMELGGNAPFIVFDDANIDKAVQGAMASKFRNAGQTCVCVNRIFVQEKVADEFTEKLARAVKALKVGHGLDEKTDIGPLINQKAVNKVHAMVKHAKSSGATCVLGGDHHSFGAHFYQPTILTNTNPNMDIDKGEIFGPIACISKFSDEKEVLHRANDTRAGLVAYFFTKDHARIWRLSEALEYGMVGVNTGILSTEVAPFGGVKESGVGREGSKYGISEYLNLKYVLQDLS